MSRKATKAHLEVWAILTVTILLFLGIAFEVLASIPINSLSQPKGEEKTEATEIYDEQVVGPLSGDEGSRKYFKIYLPSNQAMLDVRLGGGEGKCQFYVYHESCQAPECEYTPDWYENRGILTPESGWWYIELYGLETYSGVTLTADYTGNNEVTEVTDGQEVGPLSGDGNIIHLFKIYVPFNQMELNAHLIGSNYILEMSHESCHGKACKEHGHTFCPSPGWWYIKFFQWTPYSGVSLVVDYKGGNEYPEITDGEVVEQISNGDIFRINVPAGQAMLDVTTWGGTGDCALKILSPDSCDIANTSNNFDSNNEHAIVLHPIPGWWYIWFSGSCSEVSMVANCIGRDETQEITDGGVVSSLFGAKDSWQIFRIYIPTGQVTLDVRTSGGTGNCDLYVYREGDESEDSSKNGTNDEHVVYLNPATGWWYIALNGADAYSGVSLVADYLGGDEVQEITDGETVSFLSGDKDTWQLFKINVPPGQAVLNVRTWGGVGGNCDLYVVHESCHTKECRYVSNEVTNYEEIVINNPSSGWWYIALYGADTYTGVSLLADYSGAIDDILDEEIVSSISDWKLFLINVPANQELLWVRTWGGNGDCDLLAYPESCQTSDCLYSSSNSGNDEQIVISNPISGWWYIGIFGFDFSDVNLIADCVSQSEIVVLSDGEMLTPLSGSQFSTKYFKIYVPNGQARLGAYTWGGTGNADLLILHESCSTTPCIYSSLSAGNAEQAVVNTPESGWWYIALRGTENYSGVTLLVDYFSAEKLRDGQKLSSLYGDAGSVKYFMINVPPGQVRLDVHTWEGLGNCDLYAYHESCTTAGCAYKSENTGNDEQIIVNNPAHGWWYIVLYGVENFSGVNLIASYTKEITDGEVVTSLSADQGITQYFKIYIPTPQTRLNVRTWGGTGNSDLVVYHESCRSYECVYSSSNTGNNEQVVVDAPATGWWYIRLYASEAYSNVNLTADYFIAEELKDGDRVGPLSGNPGSTRYFRINVPEGQTTLEVRTWGGTGDCDLLVYHESCRTTDCEYSSSRSGNNEQVVVDNPSSGWWYIVLYSGRLAYSGVYLIADYSISIEGEGVTEGEGPAEGEGTIEGEGILEGEGISEGTTEGEGLAEGEGETMTEIFDEQEVGPLSGTQGSYQYFKINVPAGQALLDVRIWGGTGDCDLWVWHESCQAPECRHSSVNIGNNDEVLISNPDSGWWYISLYGYSEYSGVYLVADYSVSVEGEGSTEGEGETIQEIFDEQIVGPLSSLQGIYQPFKINVPAGQVLLDVRIWGGTGDCDMWIYHESCQSSECVYHSIVSGNDEEIIVNNPTPGWWYIWLYASEAYDGVYLVADYSDSSEGVVEGTPEGTTEGVPEGVTEGTPEGTPEGVAEGVTEGTPEGTTEGEGEELPPHSADQDGNGQISLPELLRVIQFFNIGEYHCDVAGEDGYNPGPGDRSCQPHASDYSPQDWVINLSELLRLIQFFNMGGYHPCPDDPESEDGYCAGP